MDHSAGDGPEQKRTLKVAASVQRMIDEPGIYITGDVNHPNIAFVIFSMGGKLTAMSMDQELAPDRFLDTFVVKHGPFAP